MTHFSPAFSSAFTRRQVTSAPSAPRLEGDIQTVYIDLTHGIDWTLAASGDLSTDAGLTTAVVLSLFTNARARDDDTLPAGQTDRRGWWGDSLSEPLQCGSEDRIGSRLWLLAASKQHQPPLNQAREYAEEALAWMVEDGVARNVEVEAIIARFEVMGLSIRIHRPDGTVVPYRFEQRWEAL